MTATVFALVLFTPVAEGPVEVLTRLDTEMFPKEWVMGSPKATATSLPEHERNRSLRIVRYGLTKYPPEVLKANLKRIYVVESLEFYGLPYGGTNSNDTVYLSNRGARNGYTDLYLESSFHHEFSSILLRNGRRRFDRQAWMECNEPEFKYQGTGTTALAAGKADTRYSTTWQEKGFLAEYASASIEEDFNMIAEGLFLGDARFWRAVDNYPRIKAKADLVIAFYNRLDSSFTEKKFRAMRPVD